MGGIRWRSVGDPWRYQRSAEIWSFGHQDVHTHDGSMVLLYMVTWIPSIYPLYVSIYTSTMDPMGYGVVWWCLINCVDQKSGGGNWGSPGNLTWNDPQVKLRWWGVEMDQQPRYEMDRGVDSTTQNDAALYQRMLRICIWGSVVGNYALSIIIIWSLQVCTSLWTWWDTGVGVSFFIASKKVEHHTPTLRWWVAYHSRKCSSDQPRDRNGYPLVI